MSLTKAIRHKQVRRALIRRGDGAGVSAGGVGREGQIHIERQQVSVEVHDILTFLSRVLYPLSPNRPRDISEKGRETEQRQRADGCRELCIGG
jgi:hypothetical protein